MQEIRETKRVIVLGALNSGAINAVELLKEADLDPILVAPKIEKSKIDGITNKCFAVDITAENLYEIIRQTNPNAILPTFGGQLAINACIELEKSGLFKALGIEILGTNLDSLKKIFDRELFSESLREKGISTPKSKTINNLSDAKKFASEYGYPVIVRAAATTMKPGGDLCNNYRELQINFNNAIEQSPVKNCLIEASVTGYKELEFEVMRDELDNCILIGSFEDFDAVGIHAADSIVVSPIKTLNNYQFNMLRTVSIKLARMFRIIGSCNIRIAFNSSTNKYYILEMNASYNRSSALVATITTYPVAEVITKVSIGETLMDIQRVGSEILTAANEPILDYVAIKIPNWSDKINRTRLGTRKKATSQLVAFGRTLESALMKAIRSIPIREIDGKFMRNMKVDDFKLEENLVHAQSDRIFYIAEAFRREYSIQEVSRLSKIDPQFLLVIKNLVNYFNDSNMYDASLENIKASKMMGYSDFWLSENWNIQESELYNLRTKNHVSVKYNRMDSSAGTIDSTAPYFYGTYEDLDELDEGKNQLDILIVDGVSKLSTKNFVRNQTLSILSKSGLKIGLISNSPDTLSMAVSLPITIFVEPVTYESIKNIYERCNPKTICCKDPKGISDKLIDQLYDSDFKVVTWDELDKSNED